MRVEPGELVLFASLIKVCAFDRRVCVSLFWLRDKKVGGQLLQPVRQVWVLQEQWGGSFAESKGVTMLTASQELCLQPPSALATQDPAFWFLSLKKGIMKISVKCKIIRDYTKHYNYGE